MSQHSIGSQVARRTLQIAVAVTMALGFVNAGAAQEKLLYTLSNNIEEGQNGVIAYHRLADGSLRPHPASPFLTLGTGIDNNTNGKLGPNDNDTPLAVSADGRRHASTLHRSRC